MTESLDNNVMNYVNAKVNNIVKWDSIRLTFVLDDNINLFLSSFTARLIIATSR